MPISQARMGPEGSRKPASGHESPEPWQATTAHQQSRLCLPPACGAEHRSQESPDRLRKPFTALPRGLQGSSGLITWGALRL